MAKRVKKELKISHRDAKKGSPVAREHADKMAVVMKKRKELSKETKRKMREVMRENSRQGALTKKRKEAREASYDGSTPLENVKEELFAMYIVAGLSRRQAYIRCGHSPKSRCSADGYWKKQRVQKRLAHKRHELDVLRTARIEKNLQAMMDIAYMDPMDFLKEDDTAKSMKDVPDNARAAVNGLEFDSDTGKLTKIKCGDKNRAQENVAKSVGQFDDVKEEDKSSKIQHVIINFNDIKVGSVDPTETEPDPDIVDAVVV